VPLLQVENVSVHYGKAQALENVSIHIHEGRVRLIVGLNGAGKTTLFNTISGFLPYSGEISAAAKSCAARAPRRSPAAASCMPESRELFGEMSVRENLDLGGQHLEDEARAKQLAWFVPSCFPILKEAAGARWRRRCSGGEQQMLAIGRALMMQPQILILDEPTLGLCTGHPRAIVEGANECCGRPRRSTVLLGEQNVTFALPPADRAMCSSMHGSSGRGDPGRFASEVGADFL